MHINKIQGLRLVIATVALLGLTIGSDAFLHWKFGLGDPVTVTADRYCGYIITPDQHKMRFGRFIDINKFGMRSSPVTRSKALQELRILLVGDSVLYGTSRVAQNQIFASLLNQELPAIIHRHVHTFNASASAWAIANETEYVQSRGIFGSQLVLLILNTEDLSQPRSNIRDVGTDLPREKYACAWCELWSRYLKPRISRQKPKEDAGTGSEIDAVEIARNIRYLDELRSAVLAGHARMSLVFVAFRRTVTTGTLRSAPPQLIEWARTRNVPLLDVTQFETQVPTADLTLDGVHLSTLGNRIVASAIEKNWFYLDAEALE